MKQTTYYFLGFLRRNGGRYTGRCIQNGRQTGTYVCHFNTEPIVWFVKAVVIELSKTVLKVIGICPSSCLRRK